MLEKFGANVLKCRSLNIGLPHCPPLVYVLRDTVPVLQNHPSHSSVLSLVFLDSLYFPGASS